MKYLEARELMQSGDVLMVKARGIVSRFIRAVTGESYNHVAMVIKNTGGVFVVEMREGKGWLFTPASVWFSKQAKKEVYWGKAPEIVRDSDCVELVAMRHRGRKYSYWTLVTVWLGQFTGKGYAGRLVCSTFIQKCWQACGYEMSARLADPGDYPQHLTDVNIVYV